MSRSVVFLCMGGVGHVHVLRSLIAGLRSRGVPVHVMTHPDFRGTVEGLGARFVDLFARHPIEAVDATSIPVPCRNVTFAGMYADSLAEEVATLHPALIIHDTFTVAAVVVARRLGIPHVNVCANHAPVPARMVAALRQDPRVAVSAACWEAVTRLREVDGMSGAHPFCYYEMASPYLNVYCEPAEFLAEEDRAAFAPIAFLSPVWPLDPRRMPARAPSAGGRERLRIYVSFGTVIWTYFEDAALAALTAISRSLAGRAVDVLVSLGRHRLPEAGRALLARPNVRVEAYVDQRAALEEAEVFVTHHGINSTHEAIVHEVPMLSYPFFGDQPALGRRCQELGLAVPLAGAPRAAIEPGPLLGALARLADERDRFAARLAEARAWELRTLADRDAILDRILSLAARDLGGSRRRRPASRRRARGGHA